MSKHEDIDKYKDYLDDYYREDELTELETHVLSDKVERKITTNKGSIKSFIKHIIAFRRYILDRDVKWYKKSVVVAAILYFLAPFDTIPDVLPFIGYLDDLGVVLWTVKFMGKELEPYYD